MPRGWLASSRMYSLVMVFAYSSNACTCRTVVEESSRTVSLFSWTAPSFSNTGDVMPFESTHRTEDRTEALLLNSSDSSLTVGQIISMSAGHSKLISLSATCSPHSASFLSVYVLLDESICSSCSISFVCRSSRAFRLARYVSRTFLASR